MNLAEIIVMGLAASVLVCFAVAAVTGPNANADNPRAVLRRCRLELAMVRRELEQIPATREAHDLYAQIASTEATIDATEAIYSRRRGK